MRLKERLDKLLVERGLVSSRQRARGLIMAGKVVVDDKRIEKPGTPVSYDAQVRLKGEVCKYVSRGGMKLERALDVFTIDPRGKTAMDVGASTGGFTDCLLQRGAVRVFAVDVGYGQLAWKLQKDPRVVNLERKNIRYLDLKEIGEPVDLIVVDTSFISVEKFLPRLYELMKKEGEIVALIKPQFEVGRGEVGKGGIVKDPDKHRRVIERIRGFVAKIDMEVKSVVASPLRGASGNMEFFVHFVRTGATSHGSTEDTKAG